VPQFSFCSTRLHADIRVPQPDSWMSDEGSGRGRKTLWRAMNMGMHHAEHRTWRDALSDRLMDMAQRPKGSVGFLLSDAGCEGGRDGERVTVDGNGCSSQFKRLMITNALIFKSTIYPECFTDRLAPWVNYFPIQNACSDLYDALVFFRGDLAVRGACEELMAKVA
ncbi:hypothetical protein K503DRAFT_664223, partial [Rhizopogon vinicolor AM-OR11-026]